MRVTIIKDDNAVNVDGERHTVDCTALPVDFHALQWNDTKGEIEYRLVTCNHCDGRNKKPNEFITDMAPYLSYVDAWGKAKAAAIEEARLAAEKVQADAAGPQA